jgi:hypothetical protein
VVPGVLTGGLSLQVPGGAREEGGVVDGARHVELARELERLAALEGLGAGEVLGALGEHTGEPVQGLRAFARGGGGPDRERLPRGGDGRVHVVGAGQFVAVHLPAGGGVDHGLVATRGALGRPAGDELRAVREPVLGGESFRGGGARVVHVALLRRTPRPGGGWRSSSSI